MTMLCANRDVQLQHVERVSVEVFTNAQVSKDR